MGSLKPDGYVMQQYLKAIRWKANQVLEDPTNFHLTRVAMLEIVALTREAEEGVSYDERHMLRIVNKEAS